jgi:hypothetical protein
MAFVGWGVVVLIIHGANKHTRLLCRQKKKHTPCCLPSAMYQSPKSSKWKKIMSSIYILCYLPHWNSWDTTLHTVPDKAPNTLSFCLLPRQLFPPPAYTPAAAPGTKKILKGDIPVILSQILSCASPIGNWAWKHSAGWLAWRSVHLGVGTPGGQVLHETTGAGLPNLATYLAPCSKTLRLHEWIWTTRICPYGRPTHQPYRRSGRYRGCRSPNRNDDTSTRRI